MTECKMTTNPGDNLGEQMEYQSVKSKSIDWLQQMLFICHMNIPKQSYMRIQRFSTATLHC